MFISINKILLVLLLCPVFTLAGETSEHIQKDEPGKWETALYKALRLFYEEDYKGTFLSLEGTVKDSEPGTGSHLCLALMRLSFYRGHGVYALNVPKGVELSESAKIYIGGLEQISDPNMPELVLLAAIKDGNEAVLEEKAKILDLIIRSASPWKDWAYWKKAQVLSRRMHWFGINSNKDVPPSVDLEDLGVVEFNKGGKYPGFGCLVGVYPEQVLIARAARVYLERYPNTYMAKQMEKDIWVSNLSMIHRSLADMEQFYRGSGRKSLVWTDLQLQAFYSLRKDIERIAEDSPDVKAQWELWTAEERLYEFLQGRSEVDEKDTIVNYLKVVGNAKGTHVLGEELNNWLGSISEAKN